ncbi:MAG: universal stress protein [Candidatus Koribacter versatilis]|uniref:Universal stress protein n=1 Tax=Candidatus Korobacter versatilis TaxID=658062 RepID=A0A932A7R0_9BACT|nr:universal stress protein [Candidatus Koribacter versatilis]
MTTATMSKTTKTKAARVAIKNILLPTDFSPQAQVAAGYAKLLAERYGSAIHAVHVFSPDLYGALPPENLALAAMRLRCDMHDRMEALHERFRGVTHDTYITEGALWPQLEKVIETQAIDLIALGSAGRRGLERVVLGSAAEEILRRAKCPVLTVGPNSAEANDESFQHILFATDLASPEAKAASFAVSLAQEYGSQLTLAHVLEANKYESGADYDRVNAYCAEQLRALVPAEAELWCEPEIVLESGEAVGRILAISEERPTGLIVIGAHRTQHPAAATHFRDSVAARVIRNARCPVLTVRA